MVKSRGRMKDLPHALVYWAPGEARIEPVKLPELSEGMVEVETEYSGLSRGTERLIFNGRVPEAEWGRMRAPLQVGDFPFIIHLIILATMRPSLPRAARFSSSKWCRS